MRKQPLRLLLAVALCMGASPLASQSVAAGPVRTISAIEAASMISVESDQTPALSVAMRIDASAAAVARREGDGWNKPLIGMVVGAVVGGLVGISVEKDVQDSMAPHSAVITVPLGALVGFVVGLAYR
jgi:hypothetical protein